MNATGDTSVPDIVRELTMLEAVVEKLAARAISEAEAHQLLGNVEHDRAESARRREAAALDRSHRTGGGC